MFVTFEGPEGAGKTTLIRALAERLEDRGRSVFLTREPGAGPVGADIRAILLHGHRLEPFAELFLFLADRAQHVAAEIKPALAEGKIVLCDRFADSTVVYQGYARGIDVVLLRDLNLIATGHIKPDLTYLLDLDPATGLARIETKNRLDSEPLEFHHKVREGFLAEATLEPDRWKILNASQPAETVLQRALSILLERL